MAILTLNQIADAIMNNVTDGLHGSPYTPIPKDQIKAEVIQLRNVLLEKYYLADGNLCSKGVGYQYFQQQINCLEVKSGSLEDCCESVGNQENPVPGDFAVTTLSNGLVVEVPDVMILKDVPSIDFFGPSNRTSFSWRIYTGEEYKTKAYLPGSANRPHGVLYPSKFGKSLIHLINVPASIVIGTKMSVTGIFLNPYAKYEYSCCSYSGDIYDTQFAASETTIEAIVETLSKRYIEYYRQLNVPIQPNDQTDKTT